MSFNLAVWEGTPPRTAVEAVTIFEGLYAKHVEEGTAEEPSPAIRAYIKAITSTYPDLLDLSDDQIDEGVWSDGPLLGNASGPFFYFGIVWSHAEAVAPFVARIALEHGLVCFDPQTGQCMRGESSL
jgi:hypothetical protein